MLSSESKANAFLYYRNEHVIDNIDVLQNLYVKSRTISNPQIQTVKKISIHVSSTNLARIPKNHENIVGQRLMEKFPLEQQRKLEKRRRRSSRGPCTASSTRSRSHQLSRTKVCRRSRWHRDESREDQSFHATVQGDPQTVDAVLWDRAEGRILSTESWIIKRVFMLIRRRWLEIWRIRTSARCRTGRSTMIGYPATGTAAIRVNFFCSLLLLLWNRFFF